LPSTEISAFAVIYAIVVGRLAFRELTLKATIKMFVDIAAMSGVLLFIVACATSLSYALTIQMIPSRSLNCWSELVWSKVPGCS
jgi:TRAP-type C4-dicarboxylate transport system permease large subunit